MVWFDLVVFTYLYSVLVLYPPACTDTCTVIVLSSLIGSLDYRPMWNGGYSVSVAVSIFREYQNLWFRGEWSEICQVLCTQYSGNYSVLWTVLS